MNDYYAKRIREVYEDKPKKKIKIKWGNVLLGALVLFIFFLGCIKLFEILFIGPEVVRHTPVGDYSCRGGLIKVCGGSNEVADYLGVE